MLVIKANFILDKKEFLPCIVFNKAKIPFNFAILWPVHLLLQALGQELLGFGQPNLI